jgi:hypothetical protein
MALMKWRCDVQTKCTFIVQVGYSEQQSRRLSYKGFMLGTWRGTHASLGRPKTTGNLSSRLHWHGRSLDVQQITCGAAQQITCTTVFKIPRQFSENACLDLDLLNIRVTLPTFLISSSVVDRVLNRNSETV